MNITIGRREINSLISQKMPGFLKGKLVSMDDGEILMQLGMKILIKEITYKFKLKDFAVKDNNITATLEGVPDALMNYAKEKGILDLKGLRITKGQVFYQPGDLIPSIAKLDSVVIANDMINLQVNLGK